MLQEAHPYDTIVLHPGLYKHKVLCDWPLKLVSLGVHKNPLPTKPPAPRIEPAADAAGPSTSAAPTRASAEDVPSGPPALPCALSSGTVTFWQERPPVVLCNCDTVCLSGLTLRVSHASHEYSSVAYGPDGRSVTLDACHVMGHTGLRIPYALDPLRVLRLNLLRCVIEVRHTCCSARKRMCKVPCKVPCKGIHAANAGLAFVMTCRGVGLKRELPGGATASG